MGISIYDANNVLLRDLSRQHGFSEFVSIRARYEQVRHSTDTDIYVFDGRGHNDRRRKLYPKYKLGRKPMAEDHFAHIKLFRQLLGHSHAHLVDCEGWEADDVIASLATSFTHRALPVTIHTNDLDYAQLLVDPEITLDGVRTPTFDPRHIPLYKATVGDPSDNIGGIPGFGEKAWEATLAFRPDFDDAVRAADQGALLGLPLNARTKKWLSDTGNVAELKTMHTVTHFWPVPARELEIGFQTGVPNHAEADALLQRFLL